MLEFQTYLLMWMHLPTAREQWLHWSSSSLSPIFSLVFAPAESMNRSSKLSCCKPLSVLILLRSLLIVIEICYSLYTQEAQTSLYSKLAHSSKEIIDRRLPFKLIRNFLKNWKHNTWLHKVVFDCLLDIASYILYPIKLVL